MRGWKFFTYFTLSISPDTQKKPFKLPSLGHWYALSTHNVSHTNEKDERFLIFLRCLFFILFFHSTRKREKRKIKAAANFHVRIYLFNFEDSVRGWKNIRLKKNNWKNFFELDTEGKKERERERDLVMYVGGREDGELDIFHHPRKMDIGERYTICVDICKASSNNKYLDKNVGREKGKKKNE